MRCWRGIEQKPGQRREYAGADRGKRKKRRKRTAKNGGEKRGTDPPIIKRRTQLLRIEARANVRNHPKDQPHRRPRLSDDHRHILARHAQRRHADPIDHPIHLSRASARHPSETQHHKSRGSSANLPQTSPAPTRSPPPPPSPPVHDPSRRESETPAKSSNTPTT